MYERSKTHLNYLYRDTYMIYNLCVYKNKEVKQSSNLITEQILNFISVFWNQFSGLRVHVSLSPGYVLTVYGVLFRSYTCIGIILK